MSTSVHSRLAAAALALCAALPARADRPLASETADVIDTGDCQVEAWAARLRASGLPSTQGEVVFTSCGVGGRHQVGFVLDQARDNGTTDRGVSLWGKTTWVAPEVGKVGFGTSYVLRLDKAPDRGLRAETTGLLGAATLDLGHETIVHANLGWQYNRTPRQSTTVWSLGIEHGQAFTVAADVFGDDRSKPWASAGFGFNVNDSLSLNAVYALQFDHPRVRVVSVGLKFQF